MKEEERIRELERKVDELAEIVKIMARASAEWGDAIGKNLLKVNMQLLLMQMEKNYARFHDEDEEEI